MSNEPLFPIGVVARRTGLSPYLIRAWERRYKAITPTRSATDRRLYSEADIARLILLRRAREMGYSLKQVAQLPTERLLAIVNGAPRLTSAQEAPRDSVLSPEAHLDACFSAVEKFDAEGLKQALARAAVALGWPALIERLLLPLMQKIGDCWREGSLRIGHEHMASAIVQAFLGNVGRSSFPTTTNVPVLIVTTPVGQFHEIGALAAAAIATSEGWQAVYLGPSLPAEEIAHAAIQRRAQAVALSIVYPADDPNLPSELEKLRRYLPHRVAIVVGGRSAEAYAQTLERIGAFTVFDWASFRILLQSLRGSPPPPSDAGERPTG